jgi:DNA-binding IclR family transcriptional regulator
LSKIVHRTLDFLEVFAAEKRPLAPADISRILHIPLSSCYDVLRALQKRGYLYELKTGGGFYPTLRIHDVAKPIADNDPVILRTQESLRALRDALDESVLLSKVEAAQAICLLALEPTHELRFRTALGDNITRLIAQSALRRESTPPQTQAWFLDSEESEPGVTSISGRFTWGPALYVVTIAGPTVRLVPKLPDAGALLMRCCEILGAP